MKFFWKICKITLLILLCVEIFLHFYNPFTSDNKSGHVIIPANTKYELKDVNIPGLDQNFLHTKNSLGFRGPEPTEDDKAKKVICMGGSATECFYLNDGKDWPALLGEHLKTELPDVWMNNAGLSGKSANDNLTLLKKNILALKPDYILLMSGLDDIGHKEKQNKLLEKSRFDFLELPKVFKVLLSGKSSVKKNNAFEVLDLSKTEMLEMSDSQILQRIAQEQPLIANYKKHLQEFADLCKTNGIKLILVSQVILYGDEKDAISDVHLANLKIGDINGRTESLLLKQYNKTSYDIAEANHIPFINLSSRLPKDSRFFYDGFHFTNDGAEMVATILYDEVKKVVKK